MAGAVMKGIASYLQWHPLPSTGLPPVEALWGALLSWLIPLLSNTESDTSWLWKTSRPSPAWPGLEDPLFFICFPASENLHPALSASPHSPLGKNPKLHKSLVCLCEHLGLNFPPSRIGVVFLSITPKECSSSRCDIGWIEGLDGWKSCSWHTNLYTASAPWSWPNEG